MHASTKGTFELRSTNHYEALGVKRDAKYEDIKKAFRQRALEFHPDKAPEQFKEQAAESFKKINEAHEILSDRSRRGTYDKQVSDTNCSCVFV